MYRGTTPTIILNVKNEELDLSLVSLCHVTLKSERGYTKEIFDEVEIDTKNRRFMFQMSQEDTFKFDVGKILVQVRIKLTNGAIISSKIEVTDMKDLLEGEII